MGLSLTFDEICCAKIEKGINGKMFNRNWRNFRNSQILEERKTREIDVVQVLSNILIIQSQQLSKVINPKNLDI